jgi:predicted RND superfamily exporter protein
MNFIAYSMDSGSEYGMTDPAYLAKVEAFMEWARQQPEIITASAFTDVLKRLNQSMHNDDPAWYRLPETRELASQYMLMYEMSLPMGMDLNNQTDTDKSSMRVMLGTRMMKAKETLALEEKVQAWMAVNMPELQTHGTGPTIMFAHIGQNSIQSVTSGSLSSIFIICLCMIFGFGSIRLGMMALLPNIFPSAIAIGLWGFFWSEVNMAIAVIFTISSGIIVDDTIHLFSKFADGLRKGLDVNESIHYSFEHAGKGVLITTAVLSSGFAVLALSDFNLNKMLGIMVSGTIIIAILFDLFFLPSVLKVFPIDRSQFYKPGTGDKDTGSTPTANAAPVTTVAARSPETIT